MATKIQVKRGTTAQVDAVTPASGEPLWDITLKDLRVGDGATAGGILLATASDYVAKALFDAYSILMATTDNTPVALTVGAQTLVGRKTGGAIAALAGADALLAMGISPTVANLNTQIRVASVEISSAEILALFTTPKELVAAPGLGNVLEFVSLLLAYDWATTAYTIGTAGDLQVKYTDGAGAAASTTRAATGYLDAVADTLSLLDKLEATVVPVANAALVLTLATANPTAGDSPIHAKVAYRVHATGL